MFGFGKKLKPLEVEVVSLPLDILAVGRSVVTTEKGLFMDSQLVAERFARLLPEITDKAYPAYDITVTYHPNGEGKLRYYMGSCVNSEPNPPIEKAEIVRIPASVTCAKITVETKSVTTWPVRQGKARQLFYETWLPASGMKQHSEIESIEMYGAASKWQTPSMDLYFPLAIE